MTFRRIADTYTKEPVGVLNPYGEGTFIDSENNVYIEDYNGYTKIGYDIPQWDTALKVLPKIGLGVIFANLIFPKSKDKDGLNFVWMIAGVIIGLFIVVTYHLLAWTIYQIVTLLLSKYLVQITEKNKIFRQFLPCVWFIDFPESDRKQVYSIAMASTLVILVILGWLIVLFAGGTETDFIMMGLLSIYPLMGAWSNTRINRSYGVHKG